MLSTKILPQRVRPCFVVLGFVLVIAITPPPFSQPPFSASAFADPAPASLAAKPAPPAQPANLYYELTDAPAIIVDWANGNLQSVVLGGNRRIAFAPCPPGSHGILAITQDAAGSRTVTWPPNVRWPGINPPPLTTTANKTDYIGFVYNGRSKTYDMLSLSQGY